ncbi:aKG-HExxH-type peptide beta-hydroxylase [Rhizobium sp. BK176]|uniref:aKG-HExxH-type peptide beta-hydroxylase n=1 Tax=Rhizobium sp. BK176 TaxID=2587071 RepID=UPI002166C369|nr:HEXXH motif-containing putative peptide modification protein [Rhizobium sp. BK176]MCS4089637.1 hypothetical protein [Rhizobium sp. BK176]
MDPFGSFEDGGFVDPLAWRADMASSCAALLKQDTSSARIAELAAEFDNLDLDAWVDAYTHPFVLAYLCEVNSDDFKHEIAASIRERTIGAIADFDQRCAEISGTPIRLVKTEPNTDLVLRGLRIKGKGSRREDCLSATLLLDTDPDFAYYADQIARGLEVVKQTCPGHYNDIVNFVRYISLTRDASFRGSSSTYHYGMVYFCPERSWTEIDWAEELIHEASHQVLECVAFEDKLFDNDELALKPMFEAPIRKDLRPAFGVFHALFVVARIKQFYETLERSGHLGPGKREYVDGLTARALKTVGPMSELPFITSTAGKYFWTTSLLFSVLLPSVSFPPPSRGNDRTCRFLTSVSDWLACSVCFLPDTTS